MPAEVLMSFCVKHRLEMRLDCECWVCDGEGEREHLSIDGFEFEMQPCWQCQGKGVLPIPGCDWCDEDAIQAEQDEWDVNPQPDVLRIEASRADSMTLTGFALMTFVSTPLVAPCES